MQFALFHLVLFGFACTFAWIGRLMWRHPEQASRFFTFGQPPNRFSTSFFRIVGRLFAVMFALGAIMYLVLIPLDLLGVKLSR